VRTQAVDGGVAADFGTYVPIHLTLQSHIATFNLQLCEPGGARCQASASYRGVARPRQVLPRRGVYAAFKMPFKCDAHEHGTCTVHGKRAWG